MESGKKRRRRHFEIGAFSKRDAVPVVGPAIRMFGWDSTDSDEPEATWEEFSGFYRSFLKFVTVSEYNREERPICYGTTVPTEICAQAGEEHSEEHHLDFVPLTFLSCYFFQTFKGKKDLSE